MAPKKKAPADAPRGKRTSAAAFSALALLSGADRPRSPEGAAVKKKKPTSSPAATKKKAAPKKRAVPAKPPPPPSETVSGRPKPTQQRERQDRPAVGEAVRVWWPPTRDPEKTGFSGAYWPARVVAGPTGGIPGADWATVRYDNGERGRALLDDLFPANPPVAFGEEREPLKAGEFVEVHNGSGSDPCAWFAIARKVSVREGEAVVSYPFHDSEDESVPLSRVRRARVWEGGVWQVPRPSQRWPPGEVTSPRELELLPEREYKAKHLSGGAGGASASAAAAEKEKKKAPAAAAEKKKKKAPAAPAPAKKKKAAAAAPKAKAAPKPKPKAKPAPPKKKKAPAASVKAAAKPKKAPAKKAAAAAAPAKARGRPPKARK